jgi:predicted MFS family arabinose efflux permease
LIFQDAGEPGGFGYQPAVAIITGIAAAALLWWLKSLPYQQSAEERLQDALDHQSAPLPYHSVA